jgi:hypothetical protein
MMALPRDSVPFGWKDGRAGASEREAAVNRLFDSGL